MKPVSTYTTKNNVHYTLTPDYRCRLYKTANNTFLYADDLTPCIIDVYDCALIIDKGHNKYELLTYNVAFDDADFKNWIPSSKLSVTEQFAKEANTQLHLLLPELERLIDKGYTCMESCVINMCCDINKTDSDGWEVTIPILENTTFIFNK